MALANAIETGEAVELGHTDVEEDEVGIRPPDERQDLHAGRCLSDDFDVLHRIENAADSFEDDAVIVREQHLHRSAPPPTSGWCHAMASSASVQIGRQFGSVNETTVASPGQL